MTGRVLRWGRAVYETDADLDLEARSVGEAGMRWSLHAGAEPPPALADATVLVVHSGVRLDAQRLRAFGAGRGRLVVTTTSGSDHIDVGAARALGLRVARCPLARRDAVVEHALAGMIAGLRRLPALQARAVAGAWARAELPALAPRGIAGSTVVIVGCGVIGARMAEVVGSMGADVIEVDPFAPHGARARLELDEALGRADVVSLHCALSAGTRQMFNASRIARLRHGAVLINTARGDLLDVDAAVAAVAAGRLGGLLVDVFPEEPYPRLAAGAAVDGVWFTPHASGYTVGLGRRVAEGVGAAVAAFVTGAPLPFPVV